MQVVIVTGLSGAGKTQAVICLEDLGYYCIDNMPPSLIKNFIELVGRDRNGIDKAAFVMDIRGGEFFSDIQVCLKDLCANNIQHTLIFLEASDEVLIRRFNETRRTHPLSGEKSTIDGIRKEKKALQEIRDIADYIIDTSNMKSTRLREEIKKLFTLEKDISDFTIHVESFGYKNGIPLDADMVFDVRFIPNPYYVSSLKKLTGNNKKVQDYVMKHPVSQKFIQNVDGLLAEIIPLYIKEAKYHLNIAFGCTGGQHRSVAMANEFARIFSEQKRRVTLLHRDVQG